jgi:hypothetical protein
MSTKEPRARISLRPGSHRPSLPRQRTINQSINQSTAVPVRVRPCRQESPSTTPRTRFHHHQSARRRRRQGPQAQRSGVGRASRSRSLEGRGNLAGAHRRLALAQVRLWGHLARQGNRGSRGTGRGTGAGCRLGRRVRWAVRGYLLGSPGRARRMAGVRRR